MEQLKLEKPEEKHGNAYYILIRDWKDSQCRIPRLLVPDYESFNEVLLHYKRVSRGDMPTTTYLLMDGDVIAGVVALRHNLDTFLQDFGGHLSYSLAPQYRGKGLEAEIIKLSTDAARMDLGLPMLVVSCGAGNTPMQLAVEANGGKLAASNEKGGVEYMTYRIKLTA